MPPERGRPNRSSAVGGNAVRPLSWRCGEFHQTAAACRDSGRRPCGDTCELARSRTPTAARPGASTAARCASARTRRASRGRRRACASRRSSRPTAASWSAAPAAARCCLARFNADGTLDTTYGTSGFVTARFAGTPTTTPGASAATALALDAAGNVLATGFGGSQSMFVARFSPTGAMTGERRLLRPAPDRLHGARARRAARRQRRRRRPGARSLARHAVPVLRRASGRAGHRRLGARQRLRHLGHLRGPPARRPAPRA